ncbi:hypothetical protein [Streptomyces sp. NPDC091212]|uniref:hypothetical protein n=1 Tax=Streptomyces sp. NPDC091212 TaxID=3155191 RepID=UPI00343058F7
MRRGRLAAYAVEPWRRTWTGAGPDGRSVGHASLRLDADGVSARLGRVLVARTSGAADTRPHC